jgi:hypothetical protein
MTSGDLSVLMLIPVAVLLASCAFAAVITFRNAAGRKRVLGCLPFLLVGVAIFPWLVFDFIYRAKDLTLEDSLAFVLFCVAALLSLGLALAAVGVAVFLVFRFRHPPTQ